MVFFLPESSYLDNPLCVGGCTAQVHREDRPDYPELRGTVRPDRRQPPGPCRHLQPAGNRPSGPRGVRSALRGQSWGDKVT